MSFAKWMLTILIATFFTMVMIYIVKGAAIKYNIPIVKTVAEGI